jgi:Rrf2 family protein
MGRYGIKLLIDLAENKSKEHITLKSVARRQDISVRYLEHAAITLRRAGLIRSVKGANGGYTLACPPENIIVGDALRVLEGDMLIIDPLKNGERENSLHACLRRALFDPLNQVIAKEIDTTTIAGLTGTVDPDESYMYFI